MSAGEGGLEAGYPFLKESRLAAIELGTSLKGTGAERYHDCIEKIARTIADLDGAAEIGTAHVSEASRTVRWIGCGRADIGSHPFPRPDPA